MVEQHDLVDVSDRVDFFWQWFAAQSETLADLLDQDDTPTSASPHPLWAELHARLRAVHPDLRMTVVRDPAGPVGLISAAGGLANVITVLQTALFAPPLPHWRIAAFHELYDRVRGFFHIADELPIDDAGFSILATVKGLRLVVYTAGDPEREPCLKHYIEIVLRAMYACDVFNRFNEVAWKQALQNFREEELIYPLNELLEVLSGLTTAVARQLERSAEYAPIALGLR